MPSTDPRRAGLWLVIAGLLAALIFGVWPAIDLHLSALFYRPETGFWLTQLPGVETFRNLIWDLTILVFVVALAGMVLALAGRPLMGVPLRDWAYVAVLYLLGPILVVNVILKSHWGRARPANVGEFGGAHLFTPFWLPTDQCLRNCSFVSGEVSSTVVMAIAMLVVRPALGRWLPKGALRIWTVAACLLPPLVAVQRLATGRHFASDTVFAAVFMIALALALGPIRRRGAGGRI